MVCPYAHSALELRMWRMEADGKQNIFEIITRNRQVGLSATLDNLGSYFMSKFGGWLKCVCGICWGERAEDGGTCCGPEGHDWNENKVLAHWNLSETPESCSLVESPGRIGNGRHPPELCSLLTDCPDRQKCAKCHSFLERDFAYVRQHFPASITIEEVCEKFNELKVKVAERLVYRDSVPTQKSHGFRFAVVCRECHQSGVHESRNDGSIVCPRGHPWDQNSSAAVLETSTGNWIPVKRLPHRLPKDASKLDICRHMSKNRSCPYSDECQFAHSELEKDVWTWQMTAEPKGVNIFHCI